MSAGYTPKVDRVIDDAACGDFVRGDWIRLALAALDQAGVTPRMLADAYKHARGDAARTANELEPD